MKIARDEPDDIERTKWAECRYKAGAEELALGKDGLDSLRLRKTIALFEDALWRGISSF